MTRNTMLFDLVLLARAPLRVSSGRAVLPTFLLGLSYPEDLRCLPGPVSGRSKLRRYPKRHRVSRPRDECKLHLRRRDLHSQWALAIHRSPNKSLPIQRWQSKVSLHLFLLLQDRISQLSRRPSQHQLVHLNHSRVAEEALVFTAVTSQVQTTMLLGSRASLFRRPMLAGWPTSLRLHSLARRTKRVLSSRGYATTLPTM
jgi:hypothetical protein